LHAVRRAVEKLLAQIAQPLPAAELSALLAQLARQLEARPQPLRWIRASKCTGDGKVHVRNFQADSK
jgi:hypothetical protein